jgi:sulfopyruvate decarboxylase subunit alpha
MQPEAVQLVIDALKAERVDLVVTLPEEPTHSLTTAIREDSAFESITVAAEGHGLALAAGASLGGRNSVFVTGIAGLLVGAWALTNIGLFYGIPLLILASYRGDVGDRSGIAGSNLFMFTQTAEPLLNALRVPYRIADDRSRLKRIVSDAQFACRQYSTPIVLLLTGEVLW